MDMKKAICKLLAFGMLLGSLLIPEDVRADVAEEATVWPMSAYAGETRDAEGNYIPAICLDVGGCGTEPDYICVYRMESKEAGYLPVGMYTDSEALEQGVFYDSKVKFGVTYSYLAIAGWYRSGDELYDTVEVSEKVTYTLDLKKPFVDVQSNGMKHIKVMLPASDFAEKFQYWLPGEDGTYADGFQIFRSRKEEGGYKQIATVSADTPFYKDTSALKGKLYFYKVRAYYNDKETGTVRTGAFSDVRMCCLGNANFPDRSALNLTAAKKKASTVKVSWNKVDGFVADAMYYACRRKGEDSFGKPELVELPENATGYTLKNLEQDGAYEFYLLVRVRVPYNDGNDNFYYDSRWYVASLEI